MESKKLFFYELEGRGYIFQNKKWDETKHGFEDDMLNMAWEMWSSGQATKAQAVPEGFVLVPRVISDEWMAVYIDSVVTKYCKDYENLPFSVEESELPEMRESHRLPIRNAHKRLIQVIEAQEQIHE